jgi:FkbM family methyltransferase
MMTFRDAVRKIVRRLAYEVVPTAALEHHRERATNDPRWVIQGYALGSEDATVPMNIMKPDFLSSFRRPDDSKVRLYTESEVLDRPLLNPYLKLDTQGFDLEVVRGASSTLPTVRALQTDLSVRPFYENAPSYREMPDALTERGFEMTALFPVGRDGQLRVIEFDCVMINGALLTAGQARGTRP